MKKDVSILLLIFSASVFLGCEKRELSSEEIRPLVGRWNLEAVESNETTNEWKPIIAEQSDAFQIRYDGVILNEEGLGICCSPKSLTFNQRVFVIRQKEAIPPNPLCSLVDCAVCETWNFDLKNDTLIVSFCLGGRSRFVKR